MAAASNTRRVVVYRALNYRWSLAGLSAGEWLVVLAPALLYLAASQLSSTLVHDVPWQAYLACAGIAALGARAYALARGTVRARRQAWHGGTAGLAASWGGLFVLQCTEGGLPTWPAASLAAASACWAVCLQLRRPPEALGRFLGGLLSPRRYYAVALRRPGAGATPPAPGRS